MSKTLKWIIAALIGVVLMNPVTAQGHCDGMDGPVVKAARKALETGNVDLVLIWVQKNNEPEVVSAFQRTISVRKLSIEARELADMYFFETVVRIHRAGEGEPYTGLKPAGRDLGPAIPAADMAVDAGSIEPLGQLLSSLIAAGIREQYSHVANLKEFNQNDVEAGRQYVRAYVLFIHYVERLYEASLVPAHGHYPGTLDQNDTHDHNP
jgi:hypothetical protein